MHIIKWKEYASMYCLISTIGSHFFFKSVMFIHSMVHLFPDVNEMGRNKATINYNLFN